MKIVTQDCSPWGWTAVDDNSYDGPGSPIGQGNTEQEAIESLQEAIQMAAEMAQERRERAQAERELETIWADHDAEYEAEVRRGEHAPWYGSYTNHDGREPE